MSPVFLSFQNKVVVGHAVHNDFIVLGIPHSPSRIRDTAKYRPLLKRINPPVVNQSVSLKRLALHLLGKSDIQVTKKSLTLLHSERPKMYAILIFLSAKGLR